MKDNNMIGFVFSTACQHETAAVAWCVRHRSNTHASWISTGTSKIPSKPQSKNTNLSLTSLFNKDSCYCKSGYFHNITNTNGPCCVQDRMQDPRLSPAAPASPTWPALPPALALAFCLPGGLPASCLAFALLLLADAPQCPCCCWRCP